MEFLKISRIAVFVCLVLSVDAMAGENHGKHIRIQRPYEMEDDVMHPKKDSIAKESSPHKSADDNNGDISQVLDEDLMRRMEMDDSEMHGYLESKKASARSRKGINIDAMHPMPRAAAGDAPSDDAIPEEVHPAIRKQDLFSVLGQDILEEIEFDDTVMHSRGVAEQPVGSFSKKRAPEPRMDESVMHPRPAASRGQQRDLPEMEPAADIPTEIDQDFMEKMETDDSLMHPSDVKGEYKKASYYASKGRALETHAHPKAPFEQQGHQADTEDVMQDEALGYDDIGRIDLDDDFGMHDPIPREPSDTRGNSRRLLSLGNGGDVDGVVKEAETMDESMKQMKIQSSFGKRVAEFSNPLHASCKINWTFGLNCSSVSKALNQQIAKWTGPDNCNMNGGEKCLYKLVSSNSTLLLATHETPEQHYVDDLSFSFTDVASEICGVFGYSTSETWYAVLDKGTNYCNLHNLITGSGLDKTSGFKESTSDDVCTQYTSADCDTY